MITIFNILFILFFNFSQPNLTITSHPSANLIESPTAECRLSPSQGLIEFIRNTETGPSWKETYETGYYGDGSGHKTYGYGLLYHPLKKNTYMDQHKAHYSRSELNELFIIGVYRRYNIVVDWAHQNNLVLNPNQLDALTSLVYNCGSKVLESGLGDLIKNNPYDPEIIHQWKTISSNLFRKFPGLKKRRLAELGMYYGHYTS